MLEHTSKEWRELRLFHWRNKHYWMKSGQVRHYGAT